MIFVKCNRFFYKNQNFLLQKIFQLSKAVIFNTQRYCGARFILAFLLNIQHIDLHTWGIRIIVNFIYKENKRDIILDNKIVILIIHRLKATFPFSRSSGFDY